MILEDISQVTIKKSILTLPYQTKRYIFSSVNDAFRSPVLKRESFKKTSGSSRSEPAANVDFLRGVSFSCSKQYNFYVFLKAVTDEMKIQVYSGYGNLTYDSSVNVNDSLESLVSEIVVAIKNRKTPIKKVDREKLEDILKRITNAKVVSYEGVGYYNSNERHHES